MNYDSPCALPRPSELARLSVGRRCSPSAACAELRIAVNGVWRTFGGCQSPPAEPYAQSDHALCCADAAVLRQTYSCTVRISPKGGGQDRTNALQVSANQHKVVRD